MRSYDVLRDEAIFKDDDSPYYWIATGDIGTPICPLS